MATLLAFIPVRTKAKWVSFSFKEPLYYGHPVNTFLWSVCGRYRDLLCCRGHVITEKKWISRRRKVVIDIYIIWSCFPNCLLFWRASTWRIRFSGFYQVWFLGFKKWKYIIFTLITIKRSQIRKMEQFYCLFWVKMLSKKWQRWINNLFPKKYDPKNR